MYRNYVSAKVLGSPLEVCVGRVTDSLPAGIFLRARCVLNNRLLRYELTSKQRPAIHSQCPAESRYAVTNASSRESDHGCRQSRGAPSGEWQRVLLPGAAFGISELCLPCYRPVVAHFWGGPFSRS